VCHDGNRIAAYAKLVEIVEEDIQSRLEKGENLPVPKNDIWFAETATSGGGALVKWNMSLDVGDSDWPTCRMTELEAHYRLNVRFAGRRPERSPTKSGHMRLAP
jgi:hypothetical protein